VVEVAEAHEQRTTAYRRPPESYAELAYYAIDAQRHGTATVKQIYEWVETNHPFYKHQGAVWWKNCIRHNLSMKECFVRHHEKDRPGVHLWTVKGDDAIEAAVPRRRRKALREQRQNKKRGEWLNGAAAAAAAAASESESESELELEVHAAVRTNGTVRDAAIGRKRSASPIAAVLRVERGLGSGSTGGSESGSSGAAGGGCYEGEDRRAAKRVRTTASGYVASVRAASVTRVDANGIAAHASRSAHGFAKPIHSEKVSGECGGALNRGSATSTRGICGSLTGPGWSVSSSNAASAGGSQTVLGSVSPMAPRDTNQAREQGNTVPHPVAPDRAALSALLDAVGCC
jgi:hypothetical protein